MELQTVIQVSKAFGISARMLRYYEQCGLVSSLRREGYAYRVYDGDNIRRLRQVVILRKLQIPVKQICVILNSPDAATAIEIFRENIAELRNEITALETIKSALEIFIAKIEEIAAVRLNLNLLTDEAVLKLAESLSLIQRNVKENKTMEELGRASDTVEKMKEKYVRVVHTPTETAAQLSCETDPPNENARAVMEKFIKDADLAGIKPDFKCLSFGHGGDWHGRSEFFVTIPENLEVPAPLVKTTFTGGLWAVYTITPKIADDIDVVSEWLKNSDEYINDQGMGGRPRHEVYFNPLNIYGLKNTGLFDTVFNPEYFDVYQPVKEIKKIPAALIEAAKAAYRESPSRGKPVEIDLTSMIKENNVRLKYKDGAMVIKVEKGVGDMINMETPRQFSGPVKIELRAKTDSSDIIIGYGQSSVCFDHANVSKNNLVLFNPDGTLEIFNSEEIPDGEFVDIEWLLDIEQTAVRVNGEVRYTNGKKGYMQAFAENTDFDLSSAVRVATNCGATVTVESLRVTEL